MEASPTPTRRSRVSRVDLRYRHRAQLVPLNKSASLRPTRQEEEFQQPRVRGAMGKDHRAFHRRAAQTATQVVTVNIQVVATVDSNGNLIAEQTAVPAAQPPHPTPIAAADDIPVPLILPPVAQAISPAASILRVPSIPSVQAIEPSLPLDLFTPTVVSLPQLPSVPSIPTVALPSLPSVPAVPPFPSNLVVPSVPAYPFSSGIAVAQALVSTIPVVPPAPTTSSIRDGGTTTRTTASISTIINSTAPTSTVSLISSSLIVSTGSLSTAPSLLASQTLDASSRLPSPRPSSGTPPPAYNGVGTTYDDGGGGGGAVKSGTSVLPPTTTASVADAGRESTPALLETPQVVGSVVGSLAGAALVLAIILLLLRRHKRRRGGALELTGDDHTDHAQPMQQMPPRVSIVPSAFLHRFSAISRSTADTSTSDGERSFQRVSGRKLPSAFSGGMTSEQFTKGDTMSGSSFYQDDHGIYGGPGLSKDLEKEIGATSLTRDSGQMNFRPSPARTPVIRHPNDASSVSMDRTHLSPPQSPNPELSSMGTLGRSLHSADGSRSSRFTENV